jgi:hypothetical protein
LTAPVIGLDVDGVLADFTRAYRVIAHELHGVPVHGCGGQPTWHPHDLTGPQDAEVWAVIEAAPRFWHDLAPVITLGEIDDLRAVAWGGTAIVYVTARNPITNVATKAWLAAHGLPQGEVRHAGDKVPVLAARPGLRGFLDDSPHGVAKMAAAGLPVYVRDWPYNRQRLTIGVPRVGSVGEYLDRVLNEGAA